MAITYENKTKLITKLFAEVKYDSGRKTMREIGFHLVHFADDVKMNGPVIGPYIEPNSFQNFNSTSQFPGEGFPVSQIAIDKIKVVTPNFPYKTWGFWKHPFI